MATNFKEVYIVFEVWIETIENCYGDYEDEYFLDSPTLITDSEHEAEEQALKLIDEGVRASTFIKFRQYDNGKLERVTDFNEKYF